jgi:branched-subunit amino acid ABC-type transport system permease component
MSMAAPIAVIVVIVLAVVLARTLKGFEIRVMGESPRAGAFAGFSAKRLTIFAFALAGGLAGLAGTMEVSGSLNQLLPSISPGYGFTAIIVAFLGRLNPVGILIAGFVLATVLYRRRGCPGVHGRLRQDRKRYSGFAAVLRARLRHADPLSHPHGHARRVPAAGEASHV